MEAKVLSCKRVTWKYPKDGTYKGLWSGHQVLIHVDGKEYEMETDDGVRCMNCECTVVVSNGTATVTM